MKAFVQLCQPSDQIELGMIKGLLDDEGITYYVNNENINALGSFPNIGAATMTLMIEENKLELARDLLIHQLGYSFS